MMKLIVVACFVAIACAAPAPAPGGIVGAPLAIGHPHIVHTPYVKTAVLTPVVKYHAVPVVKTVPVVHSVPVVKTVVAGPSYLHHH